MDEFDRIIINELQEGLPLCEQPFASLAEELEIDQETIVARISNLLDEGVLTRFGPLYNVEKLGGAFNLCALRAPQERFESIAELVNAHREVAHNYEREHPLNMWFVVATENPEQIDHVIAEIESETGCRVFQFPKQKEFFVGLKLEL